MTRAEESVWDYPRPPRLEADGRRVRVLFAGVAVADTTRAFRCLETSHPPGFYLPPGDIRLDLLVPAPGDTLCEWKGRGRYWTVRAGGREAKAAAWSYPNPVPAFAALKDHLAFYPGRVDACFVGDEQVTAQEGDFYGGWITAEVRGPFKGAPGTWGW